MTFTLPELEERVHLNGDGEGQTFVRNAQGRIVMMSGDGDHSNGGWWDCVSMLWDISGGVWWACAGIPLF